MAAAATALAKSGLRAHRHQSIHGFWKTKHSIPDPPIGAPSRNGNHLAHQLQQSKWCSRFPHSVSRKSKYLDFSAPNITSTIASVKKSSSSPKLGLVGWYMGMIKARPVATKSLTSAFIYTAADLSSQTIVGENKEGYDLVRTLRMAGYGLLIIGPSLHYWFNFVSRVFPKRDLLSTFTKMALGQTIYGPTVTTIFFSVNAALQDIGKRIPFLMVIGIVIILCTLLRLKQSALRWLYGESGSEIVGRLKRDLVPTLLSGVMYWPVCDFITFKFVPVHLQPLVSNSFSYLWTVYLTYIASLGKVSTS